jgi:hypothetical protein
LHYLWYKEINGKFIKILPYNIENLLTPMGLAHWIMGDGYYSEGTLIICTDNFTLEEVLKLIEILNNKFKIKSGKKKRINPNTNTI